MSNDNKILNGNGFPDQKIQQQKLGDVDLKKKKKEKVQLESRTEKQRILILEVK